MYPKKQTFWGSPFWVLDTAAFEWQMQIYCSAWVCWCEEAQLAPRANPLLPTDGKNPQPAGPHGRGKKSKQGLHEGDRGMFSAALQLPKDYVA